MYLAKVSSQGFWRHVFKEQEGHLGGLMAGGPVHSVVNLFWFCVGFTLAGQSQPLLLRRLDTRLTFLGGARPSCPCGGRKEGVRGRNGSVNPLPLRLYPTTTET